MVEFVFDGQWALSRCQGTARVAEIEWRATAPFGLLVFALESVVGAAGEVGEVAFGDVLVGGVVH